MEDIRANVTHEELEQHYKDLNDLLTTYNIPPAFLYNMDEGGFQEFADAVKERVIVPGDFNEKDAIVRVNRANRRITLIGCICLDGTVLKPMLITTRKTVSNLLLEEGYGTELCDIVHQAKGFVNARLFQHWAESTFFPAVREKRKKYSYEGPVVLMLDGCTSHASDGFLDACLKENIIPFFEPPGSSDQVQPMDLGIFGRQKAYKRNMLKSRPYLDKEEKAIADITDSWRIATTSGDVVSAFHQAGIYVEATEDAPAVARAGIQFARAVRDNQYVPLTSRTMYKQRITLQSFDYQSEESD